MTFPDSFKLRELDKIISADWTEGAIYPQMAAYLAGKDIKSVVDIGASSGTISYYMRRIIQPQHITCFEPDTENFELLQHNLGVFDNVTLVNKAVFYGKTLVGVNGTGDNNFLGYMVADIDREHTEFWDALHPYPDKVFECVELETYVDSADLIKMDVEGSEYNIIENSSVVQNARFLLLETHNHGREYVEQYLATHLRHKVIFTQGIGVHLGFLLELPQG